jgi:hypothetical protein
MGLNWSFVDNRVHQYCNLKFIVICLPAVFVAGCLLFDILTVGACALFFA